MVKMLQKTVFVLVAAVALMLLAGCAIDSEKGTDASAGDSGLTLPNQANDADQPPALPPGEDEGSLPPLPEGENSNSEGAKLFG